MSKIMSMKEAVSRYVRDDDSLYITGFTHLIDYSAGHEIIRQRRKKLKLVRMTPDIIYDQMIAAGVAEKLVFSYIGNPGVGSLRCIRRAVENSYPNSLNIEEYTHGSLVSALFAGGSNLPFMPAPSVGSSDLSSVNKKYGTVTDPFTGESVTVVRALNIDVAIIHVQRADESGNSQVWGIIGEQKEAAFAAKKVIVTAEEIVERDAIKADPNRTVIPSIIVSAVVPDPWGAHPSYAQGYYDRDNELYVKWNEISESVGAVENYLEEWVYGTENREEYVKKLGKEKLDLLRMKDRRSPVINFGSVV